MLADGVFSARLIGSPGDGELLDESIPRPAIPHGQSEELRAEPLPSEPRRTPGPGARPARGAWSALPTFRRMETWRPGVPHGYAGASGTAAGRLPFAVRGSGPGSLEPGPLLDDAIVRRGRLVAELQGPLGGDRFGRPVPAQTVDAPLPLGRGCAGAAGGGVQAARELFMPLVVRGRLKDDEAFTEVIPPWELGTFVNGVAFAALMATESVDSLTFFAAGRMLLAAGQVAFGSDDGGGGPRRGAAAGSGPAATSSSAPNLRLLSMHEGWKAYGWESVDFRQRRAVGAAPGWSLNEVQVVSDEIARLRTETQRSTISYFKKLNFK